jgi:hypothetical protein
MGATAASGAGTVVYALLTETTSMNQAAYGLDREHGWRDVKLPVSPQCRGLQITADRRARSRGSQSGTERICFILSVVRKLLRSVL